MVAEQNPLYQAHFVPIASEAPVPCSVMKEKAFRSVCRGDRLSTMTQLGKVLPAMPEMDMEEAVDDSN